MKYITATIFAVASCFQLTSWKCLCEKSPTHGVIAVTGSGRENFTASLIARKGRFSRMSQVLKPAYDEVNRDMETVRKYLIDKGIPAGNMVF